MKTVLFVDDETHVLDGLRRMLRPYRQEWNMLFAESGEQALEILKDEQVDVVVTDMRMPGMDGADLLAAIRHEYPNVVRIVLSGHADKSLVSRTVETAHQYIAKPCEPETLKQAVNRASRLHGLLADKTLKSIMSRAGSLPSPPTVYAAIVEELQHPDASAQRVAKIISGDAAMAAKVLQLVNSAFFGLSREVSSTVQAVTMLGIETIKYLVLSVHVFSKSNESGAALQLERLHEHCLSVASLAKAIAQAENATPEVIENSMTSGLLHDVGKLVLLEAMPERYADANKRARKNKVHTWEYERELLGTTHAEVGAYMLGLWGLPSAILEVIAFHHNPSAVCFKEFDTVTAVHVADALMHDSEPTAIFLGSDHLDLEYLAHLGLVERLDTWRGLQEQLTSAGQSHV